MSEKIRIGENEYQPPFRELDDEEMDEVWVMDANNNYVKVESVISALNELATLRQERDGLKARVEELEIDRVFFDDAITFLITSKPSQAMIDDPTSAVDREKLFACTVVKLLEEALRRRAKAYRNPTTKGGE